MKKILYCASTFSHILNFHIPYLNYFIGQGYEVHVAASGKSQGMPQDVIIHNIQFEKNVFSIKNIRAMFKLRSIIKKQGFEIISVHTTLAGAIIRSSLFFYGKRRPKCAYTCHGYLFSENSSIVKKMMYLSVEKILASKTDLLMTMNKEDYEIAKKNRLAKGDIININGMGVDTSKVKVGVDNINRLGVSMDSFVLFYAAEFSKRKNQRFLIENLVSVVKKHPNVCLVLAGEGAELERCKTLAFKHNLQNNTIFAGYIDDVWGVLPQCNVVVSSSLSEGMPFNIMEAMASGVAVCASDIKGHRDLICDGENGCLFSLEKTGDFECKINYLIENSETRKQMGRISKDIIIGSYSIDKVLPQIVQIYKKNI